MGRIDAVGTCASEVLTPGYSYPTALAYGFLLLVASNVLPAFVASSIFPIQEDWSSSTYFDMAKVVGGKSFQVLVHLI